VAGAGSFGRPFNRPRQCQQNAFCADVRLPSFLLVKRDRADDDQPLNQFLTLTLTSAASEELFVGIFPGPLDAVPSEHLRRDDLDQVARPVVGRQQIFRPALAEETQRHAVGDVPALTLHRSRAEHDLSLPWAVMRV
jgi:hypothetical protein